MHNSTQKFQSLLDIGAISLSFTCTIHCLLLPLILVFYPSLLTSALADESFHLLMVFVVIPISVGGFFMGCRRHKRYKVVLFGMVGVAVLVVAALFGHGLVGEIGERILTLISAGIVAWGHFTNYRLCRANACSS